MSTIPAIEALFTLPGVERLGWTLMHSLWQFALVALLVSTIIRAMGHSSATMRYGVLVVGLILSTLVTVATWQLQATLALEHSASRRASAVGQAGRAEWSPTQNAPGVGPPHSAGEPSFEPRPKDVAASGTSANPTLDRATHESPTAQETISLLQRIRSVMRPWLGWIVAVWSLGVGTCSFRPLLGWYTLRRLRRRATSSATDEVLIAARRLSQRLGLRRAVQVLYSKLARVPVVFGYLRPVILVPVSLVTSIPARQLEAILAHELAHVQRHDFLVNLLQTLVETLFFYHPGIWWISRRIRIEREHCCDDLAVSLLGNRVEYGRALLAIEESRRQSSVLALGAGGSSLLSRIRRLATAESHRNVSSSADRWSVALIGLAIIVVTGLITKYQTVNAEDGAGNARAGKSTSVAGKEKARGVDASAEPARLRIRNRDGSAAQFDEVVEAKIGFPNSSPGGWVGYATYEGIVSLAKLPDGTHWLVAGGNLGRPIPFQVRIPAAQPILEQHLRNDRTWMRNDIEIKTTVNADDKGGDVIIIRVRNKTKRILAVSEHDVQIMAAINDEPIRGLSPKWQSADFKPIEIGPQKSGELQLNWRAWARRGLWSTRIHEVMAEPTLPRPEHGKIWVRVCIDNRGPDLLTQGSDLVAVADPKDIAPCPAKEKAAAVPAAEEYQSATYLQKKLTGKIPDAAWGKVRDGLRLALVVRDPNNTEWNDLPAATSINSELKVRLGDEVRCQLVIENVGGHGLNFSAYSYSDVGRDVKVLDRAGGKADIHTTFVLLPVFPEHWRLLPGERFLLQMPPIHFVDKQPDQGAGYFVTTTPGDFTLQCACTLGDLSADAIQPVARNAEWTGALTTGALKVAVSDSPESDQKATKNQFGPDSARTAEDGARKEPTTASDSNAVPKADDEAKAGAVAANGEIVGWLTDSATGKPVAGATIACGAIINDSGKGGGANAITDANGRYRLMAPSPGIYNVWLKKFDKNPLMTAAADDGIRVEAGKVTTSQLHLVVGRKVTGKVVDSTGRTFAEMEVYCASARMGSGDVQSATTKADGRFEFALPPGRAHFYVLEPDKSAPKVPFAVSRSAEAYIQVPAEGDIAPVTLTLEASPSKFGDPKWLKRSTPGTQILRRGGNQDVTGTVVGEDGKPIAGAKVSPDDGPTVSTNGNGEFHIATLKGTQFVMHAVAPSYHAWFGTPTSGDVLKIVLESKQPPRAEQGAPPPTRNPNDAALPARPNAAEPATSDSEIEKAVLKILRTPFVLDPAKGSWQDGAYEAQVLLSLSRVQHHDIVVKTLLRVVNRTERSEGDQRRLAMTYLAGYAPAQVAPVLIRELEVAVGSPAVKFTAHEEIIALGRIGEDARDAIPVLIKLLDSQDWSTRGEAIDALVQIGPSSSAVMNALANRFDDPRAVYQATNYGELAKPLAPKLIKLLDSKSRPIRIWAAYGLVKSGNDEPRGFDVLIGDVAAGTVEDRSLAATALAALGNQAQSMIPKLRAYQNDPDERVAKEVLEAIRRIERDDRIFTHAQEAAKAAAARKATKKALWYLDGNR